MIFGKKKPDVPSGRRRSPSTQGRTPQAFSYHANRLEQDYNLGRQQPREQELRSRALTMRYWRQRITVLLTGLVVAVCVFNVLRLTSDPKVVVLSSSSNTYFLQATGTYERAAQKLLSSSFLNNNKITVNTEAVTTKLKQEFPELADVSITVPLISHRPIVYIASTTPSVVLATEQHESFVLDNNGKALASAASVSGLSDLGLPVVTDQSGLHVRIGSDVLPASNIDFIRTVVAEIQAKKYSVSSLTLPAAASELDVRLGGKPYFIKFNMHNDDPMQQAGTFFATDHYLTGKGVTPGQYIDVRVDGRVYYK